MNMSEIKWDRLTVQEWSEPCVSLAAEAQEVLGYSVLQDEQQEPDKGRSALEVVLAKAGIEVLNAEQVHTYQTDLLKQRTIEMLQEWLKNPTTTFIGPNWEKTLIAKYEQPIPEFVLNKAIQIKRLMPEVRIYIEHLSEHLSEHPDPFLVVTTPHAKYDVLDENLFYVEVWEEPKFEGRIR
jgi:hypothetical protein